MIISKFLLTVGLHLTCLLSLICSSVGKESACNAGELGLIPGLGRFPGERNGNPLQYSCLENPMDRGAWQATVHGVTRVGHDLATKLPFDNNPQVPLYHTVDLLENIGSLSYRMVHILALADILYYAQLVFPVSYELDLGPRLDSS